VAYRVDRGDRDGKPDGVAMKLQIESTGHLDLTTFVIAIGLILATIPAMAIYVFLSILQR
jgi:hypothetical protein